MWDHVLQNTQTFQQKLLQFHFHSGNFILIVCMDCYYGVDLKCLCFCLVSNAAMFSSEMWGSHLIHWGSPGLYGNVRNSGETYWRDLVLRSLCLDVVILSAAPSSLRLFASWLSWDEQSHASPGVMDSNDHGPGYVCEISNHKLK